MTRCSTKHRPEGGFTLIELLVTVMILSVIVGCLCDVFVANQQAWDRQYGQSVALTATNDALLDLSKYVNNAMDWEVYTRYTTGDVLAVSLPANSAHGIYVPAHDSFGNLQYNHGQTVVFYLSDSTGSYSRSGDILWAGTMSFWGTPASWNVTPDTAWSLYPGSTRGRIQPIQSIRFYRRPWQTYLNVDITVTATYTAGSGTATLSRTRTVCLRNQMY